jgi:hypothetical protein
MNAWDFQVAIMSGRYRRHFLLPNYTPRDWWECDVFELTAAGYFREYEVKLTIGDFRKDATKARERWTWLDGRLEKRLQGRKHDQLAAGHRSGPTRFYYVTPPGLLFLDHAPSANPAAVLPSWAGLIEMDDRGETYGRWGRWAPRVVRQAPELHREKISDGVRRHANSVLYYRLHTLLTERRDAPPDWWPEGDHLEAVEIAE